MSIELGCSGSGWRRWLPAAAGGKLGMVGKLEWRLCARSLQLALHTCTAAVKPEASPGARGFRYDKGASESCRWRDQRVLDVMRCSMKLQRGASMHGGAAARRRASGARPAGHAVHCWHSLQLPACVAFSIWGLHVIRVWYTWLQRP